MSLLMLHKKYGVNPTCLVCPVCNTDTGIGLLGAKCKAEAPRESKDIQPCKACQDRFTEYIDRDPNHFILLIVSESYKEPIGDDKALDFWPYFKAAYFTTIKQMKKSTVGLDLSYRKAVLRADTAKVLGLDLTRPTA